MGYRGVGIQGRSELTVHPQEEEGEEEESRQPHGTTTHLSVCWLSPRQEKGEPESVAIYMALQLLQHWGGREEEPCA